MMLCDTISCDFYSKELRNSDVTTLHPEGKNQIVDCLFMDNLTEKLQRFRDMGFFNLLIQPFSPGLKNNKNFLKKDFWGKKEN